MDLIVADGLESFELHVAALQLPFVVLFEQQRASEAHDRGIVGNDADDVGPGNGRLVLNPQAESEI